MALDQPLIVVPTLELAQGLDQLRDGGEVADPEQVLFQSLFRKWGLNVEEG
jgi:hypothetical protein